MIHLDWITCKGGGWCSLNSVNLDSAHFENLSGVYIIWHGGNDPRTVYIGKGNIKERISAHRTDSEIQHFKNFGLFVTWANVPEEYQDAVEGYLAETLSPLVGKRHPNYVKEIVNLPWD